MIQTAVLSINSTSVFDRGLNHSGKLNPEPTGSEESVEGAWASRGE